MMIINNKFEFGDLVYFITDPTQLGHLVTGFSVRKDTPIIYRLSSCGDEVPAYDYEITTDKTIF